MKFFEYKASKAWLTSADIFVELEERETFEIINGYALYWPDLGEDLSVAGFFEQLYANDPKARHVPVFFPLRVQACTPVINEYRKAVMKCIIKKIVYCMYPVVYKIYICLQIW